MANPLVDALKRAGTQTAVYWGSPQNDGYGGTTYASPVEIECRWEESSQRVVDDNGVEFVSRANVMVFQDVESGGLLYLGTLNDLSSGEEGEPEQLTDAYKIRRFEKTLLLGYTNEFVRTAYL